LHKDLDISFKISCLPKLDTDRATQTEQNWVHNEPPSTAGCCW